MNFFASFSATSTRALVFSVLLLSIWKGHSQRSTGLIMDDESYARAKAISPAQSFSSAAEPVVSLRSFCPQPGNQGDMGSCVGWSIAYGAYTAAVAKNKNWTDKQQITTQAYSALFLYNQVKASDCNGGANLKTAFDFLESKGVCKMGDFNPEDCYVEPDDKALQLAMNHRIKSYRTLFQVDAHPEQKVAMTIQEIQHGRPVVIGMNITSSFNKVGKDGVWSPQYGEPMVGGHAMCVVGYDDINQQFEVLNSWGEEYGDGGYAYVSYKDFGKYCRYGFTFRLDNSKPTASFAFKGSFYLNKMVSQNRETRKYTYDRIDPTFNGDHYELSEGSLKLRTRFKIMASEMREGNALYIFSIKPDGTGELLFPTKRENTFGISVADDPIILEEDSYIELPKNAPFIADQPGDDSLIFLFSKNELENPDELVEQIAEASGDIMERLEAVLGDQLVPASEIRYNANSMQFSGSSSTGTIVPVVVKATINP